MRFNGRELANLAQEAKAGFDKEGLLMIKEKQEGLFRKGEGKDIYYISQSEMFHNGKLYLRGFCKKRKVEKY